VVAAKARLYAKLDDYAANAYEVTNDFSANRASFQVWKSHDNWMVPYAKSSDFDDSKDGSFPHDDMEDSCFSDEDTRFRARSLLIQAKAEDQQGEAGIGSGAKRRESRNTSPEHTKRVIQNAIEALTNRRTTPSETVTPHRRRLNAMSNLRGR
jgi:hypothetical protein